jgi:transposase
MGAPVKITRTDHSAADLRALAAKSADAEQSRRLLGLAMVKDDFSRAEAARLAGMDRQTLRDWVHRYNALGVDGLISRKPPGASPLLSADQMQQLRALTLAGPDADADEVVRWRCCDLREKIAELFKVDVCERTVGKWLHKLDLVRLQPRPYHPKKDPAAEAAFKKTLVLC